MKALWSRRLMNYLLGGLVALTSSEIALRLAGATDFPIYVVDPRFGYVPAPNQSGRFLDKNQWAFNDLSMATDVRWHPAPQKNVLLVGNSIVQGGNPIDQRDRLGTLLQQDLGSTYQVWPIAAGGWSNLNEVAYLDRLPAVVAASNFFIWEYMAGGLSEMSSWPGEYIDPDVHPKIAIWYVVRRYLLPRVHDFRETELPPSGDPLPANLLRFDEMLTRLSAGRKGGVAGVIFLYPESERLALARNGQEWLPERAQIEALATKHRLLVVDIAKQSAWNDSLYRDGTHPNPAGNQVLGKILSDAMKAVTPADGHL